MRAQSGAVRSGDGGPRAAGLQGKNASMQELRKDQDGWPSYVTTAFYGIRDGKKLVRALNALIGLIAPRWRRGTFTGDNLFTYGKNLSFLGDARFMQAVEAHAQTATERGIIWRTAVLCWAAQNGLRREGDFVECGCYRGTSARIVADTLGFGATDRTFWLYDLFEYPAGSAHGAMPGMQEALHSATQRRFADLPNVRVIRGAVPAVLEGQSPERIAFLHIDMNNAAAEVGALEALFDRVSPGGLIVLDDYGYHGYVAQRDAERAWFAARGYAVIELPTSQGLVVK